MGEALGLHPVAIEDTIEFGQRPKLDSYGDHVLFVFYTVRKGRDTGEGLFEPVEVHIYISGGFVVTVRRAECTQLDALHHELDAADPKAEDYIVYSIFDVLTDAFYPIIELLEERIDALESQVLLAPARAASSSPRSTASSSASTSSRAASCPSATASRTGSEVDPQPARARPRRARVPARRRRPPRADRERAAPSAGGPHGADGDLLQRQPNRLNAVATRLTIGGTLFLVWTLVTGFFGQNFGWLVRQHRHPPRLPALRRRRLVDPHGDHRHAVLGQAQGLVLTPYPRRPRSGDNENVAIDTKNVAQLDVEPGELPPTMAAWVIREERQGEPLDAFQLEEMEVPEPGAFEVTVRVMAAGVNFNNVWAALGQPVSVFRYHDEDHHIGGSDASGIVWKVGEGVTRWQPGDEVVIHCNQASYEDPEVHGLDPLAAPQPADLGLRDDLGLVRPVLQGPGPAAAAQAQAPRPGRRPPPTASPTSPPTGC